MTPEKKEKSIIHELPDRTGRCLQEWFDGLLLPMKNVAMALLLACLAGTLSCATAQGNPTVPPCPDGEIRSCLCEGEEPPPGPCPCMKRTAIRQCSAVQNCDTADGCTMNPPQ
ncbi:MAG: hypothetical protein VYE15_05220 [Myxococcota bacterium]|nr:hypothetical protein [Myxococcota bacterium]